MTVYNNRSKSLFKKEDFLTTKLLNKCTINSVANTTTKTIVQ